MISVDLPVPDGPSTTKKKTSHHPNHDDPKMESILLALLIDCVPPKTRKPPITAETSTHFQPLLLVGVVTWTRSPQYPSTAVHWSLALE